MNDIRQNIISQKVQLYKKMQDIASEEKKEALKNNYTRILFLQKMRQQILNQIERLDKSMNTKSNGKSQKVKNSVKIDEENEAQSKIIKLIKNILQIDEETLKAVNTHRDETLGEIAGIDNTKKQIHGNSS